MKLPPLIIKRPEFKEGWWVAQIRHGLASISSLLGRIDGRFDPLFPQAIVLVVSTRNRSIAHLQRHLILGYGRACRIMRAIDAAFVSAEDRQHVRRITRK